MRHPYRETAQLLRDLARAERRAAGRWFDPQTVKHLHDEANELDRLAKLDDQENDQ